MLTLGEGGKESGYIGGLFFFYGKKHAVKHPKIIANLKERTSQVNNFSASYV